MDTSTTTAVVPFLGSGSEGANAWMRMNRSDRRRIAMQACRDRDFNALWSLTEAYIRNYSRAGATISKDTVSNYKSGLRLLLKMWEHEDLLHPDPESAPLFLRQLQQRGLKPGTIGGYLAVARGFYAALRWVKATLEDPFREVHAPQDPIPQWEKRMPYDDEEIAAMIDVADPFDKVLVLLGAHAGLRAQEAAQLKWLDVSLSRREILVRHGKGGKVRTVAMSASLKQALMSCPRQPNGYILPFRTNKAAWDHMRKLCERVNVAFKGVHSLRHSAGTRLYAETGDLESTARHLGHVELETTRVYAKWSDRKLRETIGRW